LEPQRYVFETFLKPIYKKNKGIVPVCAALGSEMGEAVLYKIGFSNMRWATGLASFNKDNVQKAFDSGLVASRCKKHGIQMPSDDAEKIIEEKVPVITPKHIMEKYGIQTMDLLQIDAEGFDYEVIKIFDIAATKPESIVFEHVHLNQKDKAECFNLLESQGYRVILIESNAVASRSTNNSVTSFFKI
jgi:FkbM family methyltransferase